jgi:hypothetical protein
LGRSGQVRESSPPPGFDPRTFQPVASRYTDYVTRPVGGRVGIILKYILYKRFIWLKIANSDCRESDNETSFSLEGEVFLTDFEIVIWPKMILLHGLTYKGCEYSKLKGEVSYFHIRLLSVKSNDGGS